MANGHGFKAFKLLLKIFLILLVVLLVLAFAAYLLAVGAPASYPAPMFSARDTANVTNVILRLSHSLVDEEGRVVNPVVLKLKKEEVQTFLNSAIRGSNRHELQTLPYDAAWDDGRLKVDYSMPLFSGRAANLVLELSPVVENGDLTLIPGRGSVGSLPLPGFALRYVADMLEQIAMQDDSARSVLSAFTCIEPAEDGTLLLMFDPRDVNTVIRILRSAGKDPSERDEDEDDEDDDEREDEEGDAEYDDDESVGGTESEDTEEYL